MRGGEGWEVEPLNDHFLSDIVIAGACEAEDFEKMLHESDTKSRGRSSRPHTF